MKVGTLKMIMVISTLLLAILTGLAFFTAPVIGSAYGMIIKSLGGALPILTADVSLPMLRTGASAAHFQQETAGWAGLLWAIMFFAPPSILIWSMKGTDKEEVIVRWVSGMSLFVPIFLVIMIIVLAGLALPFTCLEVQFTRVP